MTDVKRKKVMIVVEETGKDGGNGFDVYLQGDIERLGHIPREEMSAAEFWGSELFRITGEVLRASGAIRSIQKIATEEGVRH